MDDFMPVQLKEQTLIPVDTLKIVSFVKIIINLSHILTERVTGSYRSQNGGVENCTC